MAMVGWEPTCYVDHTDLQLGDATFLCLLSTGVERWCTSMTGRNHNLDVDFGILDYRSDSPRNQDVQ